MKKKTTKTIKPKTILIDGVWFRVSSKTGRIGKVPLTRCNNTMTESEFRSWVLSGLRDRTRCWKPAQEAWKLNTRPNTTGSRHKLEHQCNICKEWFVKKKIKNGKTSRNSIELDHIIPCGGLSDLNTKDWINKAFIDTPGYQKLCITCHTKKTKEERILSTTM